MPKAKDGFPEPAVDFKDPADVKRWVADVTEDGRVSFTDALIAIGRVGIGPLRMADPILAELVINLRVAYSAVHHRLEELQLVDSLEDEPVEPPTTVQRTVVGAVPEDQA